MRCPKCGFISFDDLVACAKCNLRLEGKNAVSFQGTAIRAQHAISLSEAGTEEQVLLAEDQGAADNLYQELAAESLEAGLTDGGAEEELDLSLAEPEGEGEMIAMAAAAEDVGDATSAGSEELPVPEHEEDIPAVDLSGLDVGEVGEESEAAAGNETEDLELDLALDEEDESLGLPDDGETEEADPASPGPAANLDGIDLSGLMGQEEAGEAPDEGGSQGVYDLSDLMTAKGDTEDVLALAVNEGNQEPSADGEEMLDLTFDEDAEAEETSTDALELDLETDDDGGEEMGLRLEQEGEGEEKPETESPSSGLSLESEDDA